MDPLTLIGAGLGAGAAIAAAPTIVAALGFTTGGIAAGSIGSYMMSTTAVANGGGVMAGSLVSVLQSVGAAGLSLAGNAVLGVAGAVAGAGTVLGGLLFL